MKRQEVFVIGFPCSETYWLARILSDLLDAPFQQYPHSEASFYGDNKDGAYIVRQRFFPESEYTRTGYYGGSGLVYIHRDPRDVATKMMLTKEVDSMSDAVDFMIEDSFYKDWMLSWLGSNKTNVVVRFEDICAHPARELDRIVRALTTLRLSDERLKRAFLRQSKNIRIGIWEDHFTRRLGKRFGDNLGMFMTEQLYIQSIRWWAVLPE